MKKIVFIQARMGSTRFPGKVLKQLDGKPVLQWVTEAAYKISPIDEVVVLTSSNEKDQDIVYWCTSQSIPVFQGSEHDVLARFYEAAVLYKADIIMRITADCPLLDPYIASQVLALVTCSEADYASNVAPATWPDGLDCEAFTFACLKYAHQNATRSSDREHVTPYIRNHQAMFRVKNLSCPMKGLEEHRWTVDTPQDLVYLNALILRTKKPVTTWSVLEVAQKCFSVLQPKIQRNEGFSISLKQESTVCTEFSHSNRLLEKALNVIPLGSQTFSKSYIQYPQAISPMFLTHGLGSKVWDVDGNEYVDCVAGLLPVILGYNDADVNWAIHQQLSKGISFSLATELEIELAELLCSIIPSAEKVRFAKNGTDVTSAAIRLARAYTGRDKIIVCGYHGWQDWYIGTTTRNKGIPKNVSELSIAVPYNDLNAVEDLLKSHQYAGMILEPCNVTAPHKGYLSGLKKLCEQYGSLLIFDEVITGFRFALGGAQAYFDVTPHLSCFGKAMGNGMPISAVVGQNNIMKEMEEIFFSGTFGGETLSLVAALTTLKKIKCKNVIPYIWNYGQDLASHLDKTIKNHDLDEILGLNGFAPWKILGFSATSFAQSHEIKTLFIQEMLKRGVLITGSFNIMYAHQEYEKHKIQQAFEETCSVISKGARTKNIHSLLNCAPIQPLFKVR